ncbi:hypothetical protein M431DRAFT_514008, partial [Trichoderma harzianum CBS 226.95]
MPQSSSVAGKECLREIININIEVPEAVSPATLKTAQNLLSRLERDSIETDQEHTISLANEIRRRVSKATRRLSAEARYTEASASLAEMEVLKFRLHYGDYIAAFLRELQGNSRHLQARGTAGTAGPDTSTTVDKEALAFFKNAKWTAIHERLAC